VKRRSPASAQRRSEQSAQSSTDSGRDIGRVREGQTVSIRADALDREVRGRIVRIGRLMGRKKVFSGEPQDKYDRDVLEVIAELEPSAGRKLPIGLRVTAYFETTRP
jgi:hypothetical protein